MRKKVIFLCSSADLFQSPDSKNSVWVYLAGVGLVCLFFLFPLFPPPPPDNEIGSLSETASHIRAWEAIYCCWIHLLSLVSLILSACQFGGIHKPVTASEDELRQQAVSVPGTAVCGLPSSPLPPCLPICPPSISPSPFSSPHAAPLLPLPYWCGFRCCCSPWWYLFVFLLDPLATGTKGELSARGVAPARAAWGAKGRKAGRSASCSACAGTELVQSLRLEMPLNCCRIPIPLSAFEWSSTPYCEEMHSV